MIGKIRAHLNKELEKRNFEAKAFKEISESDEGKSLIAQNLVQLAAMAQGREVRLKEGKPEIVFLPLDGCPESEKEARIKFNATANRFREVPYEWGQEKGKNKKVYEKAKAEYDEAKVRVVELGVLRTGNPAFMIDMLQTDNIIQMDQLINTHPEFEAELNRLSKEGGGWEQMKDVWNLPGKGTLSKSLFAGGFGARILARSAALASGISVVTALAAAAVGATIGGIRGRIRGKETLAEQKKQARYGQKGTIWDEQKKKYTENAASFDVGQLTVKLERIMQELNDPKNQANNKLFSSLSARIDYTLEKIERGQVNFGEVGSSLRNQYNLIDSLNRAVNFRESSNQVIENEISERLESFSSFLSGKLSERQKKFINKQMWKGVAIGAGAATVGYVFRWFGEQVGWWGQAQVPASVREATPLQEALTGTVAEPYPQPTGFLKDLGQVGPKVDIEHGTEWDPLGQQYLHEQAEKAFNAAVHPETLEELKPKIIEGKIMELDETLKTPPIAEAVAETATPAAEIVPGAGHEITTDFSVRLGEGGVPKNLETVFHQISADHMDLPTGDIPIDEEFGAKSLNMAANLVRLSEGHGVPGVSAEDFARAVSFKDGVLQIKDHAAFNDILEKLQGHSDELWQNGVLQGKGAAITHIDNISRENWLKIMHADGLERGVDASGAPVDAVLGHDEVTLEQIKDFSDSDLVRQASVIAEAETAPSVEDLRAKVISGYEPATEAPLDTAGPEERSQAAIDKVSGHEQFVQQAREIYQENLSRFFPLNTESVWSVIGKEPASMIMQQQAEAGDFYAPFIKFMHRLHEVTGLDPKGETFFRTAETNSEYVQRALTRAAEMGALEKINV